MGTVHGVVKGMKDVVVPLCVRGAYAVADIVYL